MQPSPILTALLITWSSMDRQPVNYLRDVKPILIQHCSACHGPNKQRAELRVDTAAAILRGGNSGPALVPGKSGDSLLIHAVTGTHGTKRMPPNGPPLNESQIAVLKVWIDTGAEAPADETAHQSNLEKLDHWAFRKPVRPEIPSVKLADWPRNPIDRFILARLEKEGLTPSPEADRVTLLRRVTLDLIGLPPTPSEVESVLRDSSSAWYDRVVDRLLASPHYGERWGRHWLDQARYADSNGYSIDGPRSIWPYRDWVIAALNRDLPFDQFTIEQVAGDLLPEATLEQQIATGFHRNTSINQEGGIDIEQFRVESIVDRVNTTGAVWLGLTIGCSQCHDHKYDPISQREYYQLFAFFNNADEPNLELATPEQRRERERIRDRVAKLEQQQKAVDPYTPEREDQWDKRLTPELRQRLPEAIRKIAEIPENGRTPPQKQLFTAYYRRLDFARHALGGLANPLPFLSAGHALVAVFRSDLEKELERLRRSEPPIVTTMVLRERSAPRETCVHLGGDFLRRGARVSPGVPAVLHKLTDNHRPGALPSRLDLARWLVDGNNPLTARVTVNRVWQAYFGTGLVETENDFGTQGTLPSHPELLDWLATEFMGMQNPGCGMRPADNNALSEPHAVSHISHTKAWSLKALHRLIVTSATYRQSSHVRPDLATLDPRNRLLARQNRLRLEAEVIRDVALAACGLLSRKIGGPSVYPPQPEGIYRFTQVPREWKASMGADRYRRGLYTHFWRSAPYPALTVFDAPDAVTTCTRRNRSNTPLQALTLLNDEAFFECAQALARRVLREAPPCQIERIRYAFRLCLGRLPSVLEQKRLVDLLNQQTNESEGTGLDAWTTVARVLLNLDEFITRE